MVAISAMNVGFLKLRKVIIWRSYLPLSQLDSRRGFWQDTLAFQGLKDSRFIGVVPYSSFLEVLSIRMDMVHGVFQVEIVNS